ncbi:MAG: hypothetical protein ACPGWM_05730, partial [Flavobacteriales bacterium]
MKHFHSIVLLFTFAMSAFASFGQDYTIIEGSDTLFAATTEFKQDSLYQVWWNQQLKKGYFAATSRKEGNNLKVEKGTLYTFNSVAGLDSSSLVQSSTKRQLNFFKSGQFNYSDLELFSKQQLTNYENNGFPFCRINFIPKYFGDQLILHPEINKGNFIKLDSLVVKSSSKFSPRLLAKLLQIEIGNGYSEQAISQIPSKVSNLPFLKLSRAPEVLFGDNDAQVYLYIEKQ